MRVDTKIAIVVQEGLAVWQKRGESPCRPAIPHVANRPHAIYVLPCPSLSALLQRPVEDWDANPCHPG